MMENLKGKIILYRNTLGNKEGNTGPSNLLT